MRRIFDISVAVDVVRDVKVLRDLATEEWKFCGEGEFSEFAGKTKNRYYFSGTEGRSLRYFKKKLDNFFPKEVFVYSAPTTAERMINQGRSSYF